MNSKKGIMVGILLFIGASYALAAAPTLKVVSASPKGQQNNMGRQAVNVHFNQPVVKLGEETAFSSATCPLMITPRI